MAEQKKNDEKKYVAPQDAQEHGYSGYSPGADEDLTLAAQVGGTANVADTPTSVTEQKQAAAEQKSTTTRKSSGS